jgi:leucyl-tRNA synthetase
MHLNTAVAAQMELINAIVPLAEGDLADDGLAWAIREAFEALARLLCPFAPHFAEEIWSRLGGEGFVSASRWPDADDALLHEDTVTLVVQVNGKLRARIDLPRGADREAAEAAARQEDKVMTFLEGKEILRVVHVPDRLLNLVVR